MSKRNSKTLALSEKEKVLNLIIKKKSHMLRLLKFTVRTNILSMKLWKGKRNHASFAVVPHTAKAMATGYKCLVKMERHYICTISYSEREKPHSNKFYYIILSKLFYFIISYYCWSLTVSINYFEYVCIGKNTVSTGLGAICSFRQPLGILECIPHG